MKTILKTSFYTIAFLLAFSIAFLPSESCAQNNLRVFEDIGGNSNSAQQESNDNTFIYVAGGLLIAGILAYALLVKKDTKSEVKDTTSSLNENLIYSENHKSDTLNERISKAEEEIPVDIFMSIYNNELVFNDKIYSLGFRIKL